MRRDAFSQYHPLINFIFFVGAIGFTVVIRHPACITASCICGGIYCYLLNGNKSRSLLFGMIPLFLILSGMNPLFNTDGETTLFYVFSRPYTLEALYFGMATAGIFIAMMLWFSCYSRVLTGDKFAALFGNWIPSLSLLLVMVLRMVPNLVRKGNQIGNARKSIGKGGSMDTTLSEKLRDSAAILSALTDWALEGSIVTADSMRARGYGCGKRTTYRIYSFHKRDWVLLTVIIILIAAILAGDYGADYTPVLQISSVNGFFAVYCCYFMIPIILHGKEALIWHVSVSRI